MCTACVLLQCQNVVQLHVFVLEFEYSVVCIFILRMIGNKYVSGTDIYPHVPKMRGPRAH